MGCPFYTGNTGQAEECTESFGINRTLTPAVWRHCWGDDIFIYVNNPGDGDWTIDSDAGEDVIYELTSGGEYYDGPFLVSGQNHVIGFTYLDVGESITITVTNGTDTDVMVFPVVAC